MSFYAHLDFFFLATHPEIRVNFYGWASMLIPIFPFLLFISITLIYMFSFIFLHVRHTKCFLTPKFSPWFRDELSNFGVSNEGYPNFGVSIEAHPDFRVRFGVSLKAHPDFSFLATHLEIEIYHFLKFSIHYCTVKKLEI